MTIFAGLDVSDKTTHVCVVDDDGAVLKRDVVASDPIPKSDPARQLRAFVLDITPAKKFKTYRQVIWLSGRVRSLSPARAVWRTAAKICGANPIASRSEERRVGK